MKICHFDFSKSFELENNVGVLVCENPHKFLEYCNDFLSQQRGADGKFLIEENGKPISFKKSGNIIFDFFNLSLSDKKIIGGLYAQLAEIVEDNMQQEYNELVQKLIAFIDTLAIDAPIAVDYNLDFELADILKATKLHPLEEDRQLPEIVCDYLDATAKFLGVKIFVLVNLRGYLTDDEFVTILTYIGYSQYEVLFLERTQFTRVKNEPMRLIDNDLCEIVVDSQNV